MRGSDAMVTRLLRSSNISIDLKDIYGRTALHHASRSLHPPVVQILLEKGANRDARDKWSRTPLHLVYNPSVPLIQSKSSEQAGEGAGASITKNEDNSDEDGRKERKVR